MITLLTRSGKASQEFFNCPVAFHGNVALLFALLYCAKATSVIKELHIFGIICHDSVSYVAPRSMDLSQMSCKTNRNSRFPGHPNCFHITLGALIAFDGELQQTAVTPVITEVVFFVTTSALRIAGDIIAHMHTDV